MIETIIFFRRIRRAPLYTISFILSALLIVAPTVVSVSIFSAIFLRAPSVQKPDRSVVIQTARRVANSSQSGVRGVSFPDFLDIRTALKPTALRFIAAWKIRELQLSINDIERSARVAIVAGDYFEMAQAHLIHGSYPSSGESAVVVSSRLAAELSASSEPQAITLAGVRFSIIGVLQDGFQGIDVRDGAEAWIPISALPAIDRAPELLSIRELEDLAVIGEMSTEDEEPFLVSAVASVSSELETQHESARQGWKLIAHPARQSIREVLHARAGLWGIAPLIVTLCVLLVGAANLANLAGTRSIGREQEMRVRLALGVPKWRLLISECAEPLILSVIGGLGGFAVGIYILRRISTITLVSPLGLQLDTASVIGPLLSILVFSVLCTIVPVQRVWGLSESEVIRQGAGLTIHGASRLQRFHLFLQVAIALSFTGVALQLALAVYQQSKVDVGFDLENLLVVTGIAGPARRSPAEWSLDRERVVSAVTQVPGVMAVAASVSEFFGGYGMPKRSVSLVPSRREASDMVDASMDVITPGYFAALGLTVLDGREFDQAKILHSGGTQPVIVNSSMAKLLMPAGGVVGRLIYESGEYPMEVIGVVPDILSTAAESANPTYYRSLTESPLPSFVLYVRVSLPSVQTTSSVSRAVLSFLPASEGRLKIQTAAKQREMRDASAILVLRLILALSGITLIVTCLGLYSVTSSIMGARRKEFAILSALGASPLRLALMVFGDGFRWTIAAMLASIPSVWVGARVASSLVLGVRPIPIAVAIALLVIYCFIVCLSLILPALRSASEEPALAIRTC